MPLGVILAMVLLMAMAYLIGWPLIAPVRYAKEEDTELLTRKEKLLEEIRDLDMDYASGKLSETDYRQLRARSLADAAAVMKQISEAPPVVSDDEDEDELLEVEDFDTVDDIERQIAERKAVLLARSCPACGTVKRPGDRECRSCGAMLPEGV